MEQWRAKHSFIEGRQLVFTGTGVGLFGLWIKWFLLIVIKVGIYGFWVAPQIAKWKWELPASHPDTTPAGVAE